MLVNGRTAMDLSPVAGATSGAGAAGAGAAETGFFAATGFGGSGWRRTMTPKPTPTTTTTTTAQTQVGRPDFFFGGGGAATTGAAGLRAPAPTGNGGRVRRIGAGVRTFAKGAQVGLRPPPPP